jgi:DNA-binding response OmpR family regulator
MSHGAKPTILLVEPDTSLRRLITLGLQYRGMNVIEANLPAQLPTIEAQPPDLLILDVDGRMSSDWSLLAAAQTHPYLSTIPIIVLTWECPVAASAVDIAGRTREQQDALQAQVSCLAKPFDARTLHMTIEQLLVAVDTASESSNAQEILLIAQTVTSAPSIWPLVTAAGLLLAFIGLMGLFAISVLGLLIVFVSLLWWTLGTGTKKETRPLPIGG